MLFFNRVLQRFSSLRAMAFVGLLVFWSGCASTKAQWDSRIGRVSLDELVLELGPPDRSATLTDGSVVAEWLQYRGFSQANVVSPMFLMQQPYASGFWPTTVDVTRSPDSFLRLTFGPDKKLNAWRKVYR
jgi:hypothetical protein